MSQDDALVAAAVEHLRTYAASLHEEEDGFLIRNGTDKLSSSTLPKIKYWFEQLTKALQSEETRLKEDDGFDCGETAEVLASILRILDDTDAKHLQIRTKASIKPLKASSHNQLQQARRRKRLPVRSSELIEAIHESQEVDYSNNCYDSSELYLSSAETNHRAKRQKNSCADVKVSLKDVLNAKTTDISECAQVTETISNNAEKKDTPTTMLLLDAAVLRRDLYKLLVHVDSMNIRKCIKANATDKDVNEMVTQMISSLLRRINTHPNSPSMRLSSIMAVDCLREMELSDSGYQLLLDDLLSSTQSSLKAIYVKFYAEMVSECNVYASPSRLLRALVRLMRAVMRNTLCRKKIEEQDSKLNQAESNAMEKNLLQAISQIMVQRSNILRSLSYDTGRNLSKLYSSYKLVIRRMSNVYDKVSCWTHSDDDEQEQVVSVLQAEGILSIFCWDETDEEQSESSERSQQVLEGPHKFLSLRAAHDRLGPCRGFDKLLSHSSIYAMKAQLEGDTQDNVGLCSAFSGINSDVLRGVFSYLGYRSLARASSTCKNWNLASNDNRLWIALYFRKYKSAIYEEEHAKGIARIRKSGCFDKFTSVSTAVQRKELATTLAIESHYDWRYIFKRKYLSEKHVSKTFLRCEVIGCVAHYGRRSANMHKKMHEKVISSRATAIKSLEKLERNVISLREKVRLKDAAMEDQQATQKRNVLCVHSPEDTLAKVFSFLDVKDLHTPVCKMWTKILSENEMLWKSLYFSHFGLQQTLTNVPESWSACFRATHKAERGRRKIASHDSLGWTTKLCPVVGCCTVLYNQLAYSKHILTHEQESLRLRLQQKSKKKRKRAPSKATK